MLHILSYQIEEMNDRNINCMKKKLHIFRNVKEVEVIKISISNKIYEQTFSGEGPSMI